MVRLSWLVMLLMMVLCRLWLEAAHSPLVIHGEVGYYIVEKEMG
jgi:HD superfamily phosphohydrolase YqeK